MRIDLETINSEFMATLEQTKEQDAHIRQILYAKYDRLSDLWSAIEARCAALQVAATVDIAGDGRFLSIRQHRGQWRICHTTIEDGKPVKWQPIVECSVVNRVDASHAIQALLDTIARLSRANLNSD